MSPVRFWQKAFGFFRRRRASPPPAGPAPSVGPSLLGADGDEAVQSAVERLLEDEALTADLVDAAARHLLDWGIAQVTAILRETGAASEEAGTRLAALRQQMRAIARQVGQLSPDEQASALQRLLAEGPGPATAGNAFAPHETKVQR
ncbi:MAG: hypothetical protein ACK4WK_03375 [Anaerolineae bacterium]